MKKLQFFTSGEISPGMNALRTGSRSYSYFSKVLEVYGVFTVVMKEWSMGDIKKMQFLFGRQ